MFLFHLSWVMRSHVYIMLCLFSHIYMVILVYIMLCLCLFSHIYMVILVLYTWLFLCEKKIEDTKGVNRSCKLKKVIQYNCQKKKVKRTNNDQQNKHYPEKKSNPAKNWTLNSARCYGMVSSSWSTTDYRRVSVKRHEQYFF